MDNQLCVANLLKEATSLLVSENSQNTQHPASSADSMLSQQSGHFLPLTVEVVVNGGNITLHNPFWTYRFCVVSKYQQVKSKYFRENGHLSIEFDGHKKC